MPKKSKKSNAKLKPTTHKKILWALRFIPFDLALVMIVLCLSMFIRWWPLEFIVSYLPQVMILFWVYLMLYAAMAVWYIFVHSWDDLSGRAGAMSFVGLGVSLLLAVFVFAYSVNIVGALDISKEVSRNNSNLTVGTFNKLYRSTNFSDDAGAIAASQVDIFSLQEVSENEVRLLRERVNYEYSYITECDCSADDTEVGLISKFPIINAKTIYEHQNAVIARTVIDSELHGRFVVYLVHMHVPYQSQSYKLRKTTYEILSEAINGESLPTFAVGDFNTTIYSPDMQNFMRDTPTVRNIVARSWPRCTWYGYSELACARIDYVFAPTGSIAYGIEIGQEDNSDHRSVIVELSL